MCFPYVKSPYLARVSDRLNHIIASRWFVPSCFLLALALRLIWIVAVPSSPVDDGGWYVARAISMSQGQGYAVDGHPTAYWPVGYPAFLSMLFMLFSPKLLLAKCANVALSCGTIALAYQIGKRLFSPFVGRILLFLLAIYPNHIAYAGLLTSETLFTFLLFLGCFLHLTKVGPRHWGIATITGIIFGMATLVRPQVVLLPIALEILLAIAQKRRQNIPTLLRLYLGVTLTITPWILRDYHEIGHLVFISTNGGINLYIGNNPTATGRYYWPESIYEDTQGATNEYEFDSKARAAALDYMREHPWETVRGWPRKLFYMYRADTSGTTWNMMGISSDHPTLLRILSWIRVIAQGYYMLMMLLALIAIVARRTWLWQNPAACYGLLVTAYFTTIYMTFFGENRYQFQNTPWLIMYAAALIAAAIAPARENADSAHSIAPRHATDPKQFIP